MCLGLFKGKLLGATLASVILVAAWCPAAARGPVNASAASDDVPPTAGARSLERYGFQGGFLAGSLRAEIPLPLFDPDPDHLWNRLFAAFWVRPLKPSSRDARWTGGPPRPMADEDVPPELSARLRALWRQTYNQDTDRRIEGGDVLDPPLSPHPDSLLGDRYFRAADAVLDEFLRDHSEQQIHDPAKRAILQRDLWPVFDILQRGSFWDYGTPTRGQRGQNPDLEYTEAEKGRKATLSRKIAAVMQVVALSKDEVAVLPDTYDLAVRSGRFAAGPGDGRGRPYLPAHLMDGSGEWIEVNTYVPGAQFHGLLSHTGVLGFEGRAWFRVFYRFPAAAGGRRALERFLANPAADRRDAENRLMRPDVPTGTEVALARMLLLIDRDGEIHPTRILEDLQLRVLRYVDGHQHPDTDSGFGQDLFEYELRRAALFESPAGGGLVRVPNDMPRYFLAGFPFSTFATFPRFSPESAGLLRPLGTVCTSCHEHANVPRRDTGNELRPFPEGYTFGKASLLSLTPARIPMPEGGAATLAKRVIDWKVSQPSFRNLAAAMRQARR